MAFQGRRRMLVAGGILAATALLAACGGAAGGNSAGSSSRGDTELRVVDAGFGKKLNIADDNGFFAKHGLKVKISGLASGVDVLAALQGGSADIGYADLFAGINAASNGFDIRLIVNNNGHPSKIPFLVRKDSGITKPSDLAGKTIGVPPVPQMTVSARGYLANNNVDASGVKFTVIRDLNNTPEVLQGGSVDAAYGSYAQLYLNQGQDGNYDFTTVGDLSTASYTSPKATTAAFWAVGEWAEANRDTAQRFADAIREYNAWYLRLPVEKKAELQLKYFNVDYLKISGGDPQKLADLLLPIEQDHPLDFDATLRWYETGLKYAGDKIAKGVDLRKHIFPTALGSTS